MLSYKKWKKINENFGVNLGVKTPNKINSLHSKWDEMGMSMPMMKKPMMMKKKMFGGGDGPDMGSDADDDLHGSDDGGGGVPPFMKKKGKGKKPPFPPHGDDDMGDDDMDSPEGDHDDELDADMDGDDLGHDDDDMGDDAGDGPESDMGDEEAPDDDDDDDMGGDKDLGVGGPDDEPAPAPKGGKKGNFIDKTKAVADGAKMMHKGASKMIKGMKEAACDKCDNMDKKWSKKSKKMTKEESEFWRSLQSQTGATKFSKDNDGSWTPVSEDAIIPPSDPNANIVDDDEEAGPGEPGYAPQGRVGSIGSFSEWVQKYKRKSKINESKRNK